MSTLCRLCQDFIYLYDIILHDVDIPKTSWRRKIMYVNTKFGKIIFCRHLNLNVTEDIKEGVL